MTAVAVVVVAAAWLRSGDGSGVLRMPNVSR
jgi:hypothetical protein